MDENEEKNVPEGEAEVKKKRISEEVKKEVWSWVKTIASAAIFAYIITTFIIVNAQVPTGSMKNTIMPGDRLIASRLSYMTGDPKRFDIAVFKFPDDETQLFVKRVIGLPGETVQIADGKVYIDGAEQPLDDSFVNGIPTGNYGPYHVPEGCYFMLGDNRESSKDSRFWTDQYVKKNKILGKAVFRYWKDIKSTGDRVESKSLLSGRPSFKLLGYTPQA